MAVFLFLESSRKAAFFALTGIAGFLGPMLGGWLYEELVKLPLWVQTYGISTGIGIILLLLVLIGRGIFNEINVRIQ